MSEAPEQAAGGNALFGEQAPEQSPTQASDGHAQSDSWFAAYPEETQTFITNRGYDKIDQSAAFEDLTKGYQSLHSKLGGNADELFKINGSMTDDDLSSVYSALGKPETVEGYSYKAGEGESPELVEAFLSSAHELGLNDNQVSNMIPKLNEKIVALAEANQASINSKNAEGLEGLKKEWAGAYDQQVNLAMRAMEHFGISEDVQNSIRASGHSAEFAKAMSKVGGLMSEGQMVGMNPDSQKAAMGAMTVSEANSKISEIQGKIASTPIGDRAAHERLSKELEPLYKILAG